MTDKDNNLKLKDPLFDVNASISSNVMISPISNEKMFLTECNNIPVWVHLQDRTCLPVKEEDANKII